MVTGNNDTFPSFNLLVLSLYILKALFAYDFVLSQPSFSQNNGQPVVRSVLTVELGTLLRFGCTAEAERWTVTSLPSDTCGAGGAGQSRGGFPTELRRMEPATERAARLLLRHTRHCRKRNSRAQLPAGPGPAQRYGGGGGGRLGRVPAALRL